MTSHELAIKHNTETLEKFNASSATCLASARYFIAAAFGAYPDPEDRQAILMLTYRQMQELLNMVQE